jgi:uncharacterized protein with HEPN domain
MSPRSERAWRPYAEDITEACGKVRRYVAGMTFEAFEGDERTRDTVIRNIELIGEAAKNLPDGVIARAPRGVWSTATAKLDGMEPPSAACSGRLEPSARIASPRSP